MDNPFQAPRAELEEEQLELELARHPFPYYQVSLTKLIIFSLITLNSYLLYWFYKQWQARKMIYSEPIWPIVRAIFMNIFAYALFRRVLLSARADGLTPSWRSGWLFLAFFILGILNRFSTSFNPISLLAFLPLIPVQNSINLLFEKTAPPQAPRDHFTTVNWVFLVVISLVWVFFLIRLFFL